MGPIFLLCDRATTLIAEANPILSTYIGVEGNDHRWTDMSPDGFLRRADQFRQLISEAEGLTPTDENEALAKEVLIEELQIWIDSIDQRDHFRDLNSIESPHQQIRRIFDGMKVQTTDHWHCIIARLETIDEPIDGYRRCLDAGLANEMVVAKRQVEAAIEQGHVAAGPSSELLNLITTFDKQSIGDDHLRRRLVDAVQNGRDAYANLTDWLESTYLPQASSVDGVGRDRYVRAATRYLGTEIDPEQTYAWGWAELKRLWNELHEIGSEISPGASIEEVIHGLNTDPDRAATSLAEFVSVMKQRQQQALQQLAGTHFDVPEPIRRIDVKVEPASGALAPHYSAPSEDFARLGAVWYPVEGQSFFPLFEEVTTAYHEGFPGHHLQVGVQMSQAEQLSRFHRLIVWYPGSGEGWALYAEHLMDELGFLETPDYRIGLILSKLVRTCRIVIDIGVHLDFPIPQDADFHGGENWTFDLAKELLMTRAFQAEAMSHSEITRYFGWPGQAISYKIGEQALLDLRHEAQSKPGFDAKQWHADVLGLGSIGLDLLGRQMRNRW